jgi:DNA-binding NarL/FixJ family response regulator
MKKGKTNQSEESKRPQPHPGDDLVGLQSIEDRHELTFELLDLLNRQSDATDTIREILMLLKESTGFEAIAIRLEDGDDFPYYMTNGFPGKFVEAERHLCVKDSQGLKLCDKGNRPVLECMCGNVIRGRTDPTQPFFTDRGSFWTNNTTQLLATTTEKERQAHTRNRCNGSGYESVALIPLRSNLTTVGLLQLNDSRPERFSPEMISFFEGIGDSIGIALARIRAEEKVRKSEAIRSKAEGIAGLGSWEWDIPSNGLVASSEIYRIFGLDSTTQSGDKFEILMDCVDPMDLKRVRTALERARDRNKNFDIQYSIKKGNEGRRYVRTQAEVICDSSGSPIKVVGLTQDITEQKLSRDALKLAQAELEKRVEERTAELAESNRELKRKSEALEKKNIALHEILDHIGEEKKNLKRQITTNVEESIIPTILRLKESSDPSNLRVLEILEKDLKELSSPFLDTLRSKYQKLTPRELEVCRMVRHGYTSKEIALALHNSEQTIIKQRKSIRKKLEISNSDINLASFLESMEEAE